MGIILIGIYPYRPNSAIGWCVFYLLSLPIVIVFEVLGDSTLGNKYISRSGRFIRIIYGVIVLILFIGFGYTIFMEAGAFLGKWGE